jgi:hypothetical protein
MGYERRPQPPGCRNLLLLEQEVFGLVGPIVVWMFVVISAVVGSLYLLVTHPVFALLPFVALFGGVWLFRRWERGKS